MYTGKNDDVIEFNIDFDALFYTAVNVLKDNLASLSGADKPVEGDPKPDAVTSEVDAMLLRQTGLQFNVIRPVAGEAAAQGFNAWQNTSVLVAADIMKSVYSGARGDMINLQVKIVGDPDFIKQDDLYLSPSNPNYPADGELFAPDGSILTDRGDIFCRMTFRTPVDMDPATGGLRHDNAYLESNFSGVYKIIKVTNELRGGKFEQVLNMIRWPDDPLKPAKTDSIQQRANKDTAKADREANNAAILAKVNQAVNSGATTESAKTTDSLAVASRRRNAEAREKSQSKPATATLPARIAGRPFGRGVPQSAKTNWDKQYSANYNPDGTLKAGTGPGVDPRLKKVANTGDTKSIADAPEFLP
jgi:hypothetical protein